MKKKALREWIKENREALDKAILKACPNCRIDDDEILLIYCREFYYGE
jgi:hypothetical protein